jgi:ppGpp synthetase/RelA/SpoT-type nucleotidyltranferase
MTIARLIRDHFPWGEPGFPASSPAEPDQQRRQVEEWLGRKTAPFEAAVAALVARVRPILRLVDEEVRQAGEERLVNRIDLTHATKSPASILEKMVRAWKEKGGATPPISFTNFSRELDDLGRFRVVTNFLSDADRIADRIAAAYDLRQERSDAQRRLATEFLLHENAFEDKILVHPRERRKGQRCRQGIFEPRRPEDCHLRVEVQIQTLLQEAWDKKDHYLLYEPRRRGETVALQHECEMFAMSELLYVADLTFDRLREAMLEGRRGRCGEQKEGGSDASS